ncbi:DUF2125 domain-containing protein [Shimia sp. R11_0]|uniref:DUF2125 domain-containing protein n=1 Tax=Shimia sp. R11_0 TaxID=2821096 RepID=UPI001ADD52AA|nr:DUF2125 domain-containing protein [Shimia sp. R11_0]MBO9478642.1 DUF2125 domain-containing protein [Shimia sp. R11_0]
MQIASSRIFTSTALATVFCAQSAFADVSASDVWENWQSYMSSYGYEISASEAQSGDTLTISDLVMNIQMPEEAGKIDMEWGTLTFVENGDGTVTISLPASQPMVFRSDSPAEKVSATMDVATDLTMVASGDKDALKYTHTADALKIAVTELVVNDEKIENVDIAMAVAGMSGESELLVGELTKSRGTSTIETTDITVKGTDPESGAAFDFAATLSGLKADVDSAFPEGAYSADPMAFFAPGMMLVGGYTFDGMTVAGNFEEDGAPGSVAVESGGGSFNIDMSDSKMAYDGRLGNMTINVAGADIPVPIDVSFGEFGYGFSLPIAAAEAAQDFAFNLTLADLEISELLWGMFDPAQVLPRDPATLVVDLVGKGTVLQDLMTLDETTDEMPGELNALTIRDLRLNAAGASVEGSGDFVFDNTDLESFDGLPRPEGAIDIKIDGVNGLMDKLIQMGLLPEEQAMGARMMMSMFTQPGEGDDSLTSKIEVNEQGHVLANGQRLK